MFLDHRRRKKISFMTTHLHHSLWKHQKDAIALSKELERMALFFEEGTGKTRAYIEIIKLWSEERPNGSGFTCLVLCPPSLIHSWKRTLAETEDFCPWISWTLLTLDQAKNRYVELGRHGYDCILVDEASKIKRASTRTKNLIRLANEWNIRYRLIGTGTPFGNAQGMELFFYSKFLWGTESAFGTAFYKFRNKYYEEVTEWDWQPKEGTFEAFYEEWTDWGLRVLKTEVLELEPKVYEDVQLRPLKGISKKLYTSLKKDKVAALNGKVISSDQAMKLVHKRQQLACGVLNMDDDYEKWMPMEMLKGKLDNPKLEWLKDKLPELLAEDSGDILITGVYTTVLNVVHDWVSSSLTDVVARYYDCHRCDPEVDPWRVLVANQKSVAFGLNLQRLGHIILFGNDFSLEVRKQLENRAHRGGQTKQVVIWDLSVEGTMDEYVVDTLLNNKEISDAILQDK